MTKEVPDYSKEREYITDCTNKRTFSKSELSFASEVTQAVRKEGPLPATFINFINNELCEA